MEAQFVCSYMKFLPYDVSDSLPLAEFFWLYRRFVEQKDKENKEASGASQLEMPSNPALSEFLRSTGRG